MTQVEVDDLLMARRAAECPVQFVQTSHGKFAFHVEGPTNAQVVVAFHGSMCSRKQWIFPTPLEDVRIVAITRPGYDESDDVDPRKFEFEMMADIVKAVLDSLSVDTFHVMGHSGGGPYAIAVKALMSPRCQRCIVLAGESEYASDPKIDPVGMRCLGPRGCCASCGLCCMLPIGMKCMMGSCCSCSTTYKEAVLKKDPPKEHLQYNLPGDLEQLGEHGDQYAAFMFKVIQDSMQAGLKRNGAILDFWVPKKGWNFKATLSDSTFPGGDVEIWAGELDKNVPMKVAEHNHSLIPGSKLHVAKGIGHTGVGFPLFVAERVASISAVDAPVQDSMAP
eukprot:TRINITY_DN75417_c0_g1_i1.p1 TRINITY_DN75417_c0_g1~~TRINITY_DN75417_c0_g1_i1.p1  ORF type:complete len:335 (-),score=48.38 TRINITY_DN75417_c0_g1_i1:365-1369(-)